MIEKFQNTTPKNNNSTENLKNTEGEEASILSKELVEHTFKRNDDLEFKIEDTKVKFTYSSPDVGFLLKSLFRKTYVSEQNKDKLDILMNLRKIDDFTLTNSLSEYSIKEILPKDWQIFFFTKENKNFSSSMSYENKIILLNKNPLTVGGVLSLGHEVGHYEVEKDLTDEERTKANEARTGEEIGNGLSNWIFSEEGKKLIIKEERSAWAHALKRLRHFNEDFDLSDNKLENFIHNNCLKSYEDNIKTYEDYVG